MIKKKEEEPKGKELIIELGGEDDIIDQVRQEYKLCYDYVLPKIEEWLVRLTIYNNQKRDKTKVGDPLLFTVFQTLLASLYDDRLSASFLPREEGDNEVAENLDQTAEFDYDEMEMPEVNFEWDWDAGFFGRGLLLMHEFDRKRMVPVPEVIDPCTFLRDPDAVSVNGNSKGYNALRFWGREFALTKDKLKDSKNYFNLKSLKTGKELKSLLQRAKDKRREAQGLSNPLYGDDDIGDNSQYNLLEWNTHIKGNKYLISLGNAQTKIVRITKLKNQDSWDLIDRPLFPTAHDWDGVSIPDLVEDKQRARAVLTNLGLESAKADVEPMYLFDETRIKNRADLNFGFNKFVRVQGAGAVQDAVQPMNRPIIHQQVSWIMDLLDQSAQRALATPEIQQGIVSKQARTLGELELVSAKVDTRYSLAAKIFGWSEKKFWQKWYMGYKKHFKDKLDEKMVRIAGVWGPEVRKLTRENLIGRADPDINISSKIIQEAKRVMERNAFTQYYGVIANNPEAYRRFADKELARLNGLSKQKVRMLFPDTLDEMEAEKENEMLEKKQTPSVEIEQNDHVHIVMHLRIEESDLRDKHIKAHKYAMYLKRKNPALVQAQPNIQLPGKQGEELPEANAGKGAESAVPPQMTNIPATYGGQA